MPLDDRFYSAWIPAPLSPEALLDAIADATGVPEAFEKEAAPTRSIALVDPRTPSLALDALGRCAVSSSCDDGTREAGLAAQLHLLNGPVVNAKIRAPNGTLARWIEQGRSDTAIVEAMFLATLSRAPHSSERELIEATRGAVVGNQEARRERLEDVFWSLLNSNEFRTNH